MAYDKKGKKMTKRKINAKIKKESWKEYPDPTPVAIPVELQRPESMDERLKRILADDRMKSNMMQSGLETIDEASDFDVEDTFEDDAVLSPHVVNEMAEEYPKEPLLDLEDKETSPPLTQSGGGEVSEPEFVGSGFYNSEGQEISMEDFKKLMTEGE